MFLPGRDDAITGLQNGLGDAGADVAVGTSDKPNFAHHSFLRPVTYSFAASLRACDMRKIERGRP
jgi:hypothetical protein